MGSLEFSPPLSFFLSHCTDKEISIKEGPLLSLEANFHYKFIELSNSTFIVSNHFDIQSDNKLCVLFWLGDESQIVLTTNVVR